MHGIVFFSSHNTLFPTVGLTLIFVFFLVKFIWILHFCVRSIKVQDSLILLNNRVSVKIIVKNKLFFYIYGKKKSNG